MPSYADAQARRLGWGDDALWCCYLDSGIQGLAFDADIPAKVTALLVGSDIGPISAFEIKRIDAKGILLLSEDATSTDRRGKRR